MTVDLPRRALLRAAVAAPAARALALGAPPLMLLGCGDDTPEPPTPDEVRLDEARAQERGLLAGLVAAAARHPQLSTLLGPLRLHHEEHLAALEPVRPSTAASPSAGLSPAPEAVPVPADPTAAVLAVVAAERAAGAAGVARATAQDGARAALFGRIAAAEAAHAEVLEALGAEALGADATASA